MLLIKLQNEEKFAFLSLAHHIAHIDGEFEKEEKDIIEEYCLEMGIENKVYDESKFHIEEVLAKIKTPQSQKIVILELMVLIHSDDKFHRFEHQIIEKIAEYYHISNTQLALYSQWGKIVSASSNQAKIFLAE